MVLASPQAAATTPEPSQPRPPEPLPLRIVAPIHGLFYQFSPTGAYGLDAGASVVRLELADANVLHLPSEGSSQVQPVLDFEMTRLQLAFEHGLSDRWNVGVEVPFLSFHTGWLDETIFQIEETFGKIKPRRRRETPNHFSFEISRNGEVLFAGPEGGAWLGDVALTTRYVVERGAGTRPTIALRGALKLPTGDRDRTTGSGVTDLALAVVADWHTGRWSLWSSGALTVPLGDVRDTPGFDTEPIGSLFLEIGYRATPRLRLHTQLAMQSGPFDLEDPFSETGLPVGRDGSLTHHIVQLTPGVAWNLGSNKVLYLGIVEDFYSSERSASDAALVTALHVTLP